MTTRKLNINTPHIEKVTTRHMSINWRANLNSFKIIIKILVTNSKYKLLRIYLFLVDGVVSLVDVVVAELFKLSVNEQVD